MIRNLPFWKNASPRQKRIYSTTFVLVLSVLATLLGMLVPMSQEDAQMIADQLNQTVTQGTAEGTLIPDIFLNNFPLCLLMFIPLAGFGIGMFILFSTGMAFRAVFQVQAANGIAGSTANIDASTAILVLALVAVVFLLEYVSYAIAMTESVWLFRRILQKQWKGELKCLGICIGIVALMLIIGAIVETYALSIGL